MTIPAATQGRRVASLEGALELAVHDLGLAAGLAVGEDLADAQDRAQAAGDGAVQLLADQLVGLAEVGAALGVAEDDPGGQAGQHRHGDLAGVGPGQLVVDVLGTHAHVLARQRVAHGGQAHVRRADDAGDPGLPRPRRDGPRELGGVGGGGVHLPVGGNHDRAAHARIMPERARPFPRPTGPPPPAARPATATAGRLPGTGAGWPGPVPAADALVVVEGEALHRGRAPAGRPSGGARDARRSRTATPRASRDAPRPRPGRSSTAPRAGRRRRARRSPRAGGRRPRRTAGGWRSRR